MANGRPEEERELKGSKPSVEKKPRKDAVIILRFPPWAKARIKEQAALEHRSVSDYMRRALVKGLRRERLTEQEEKVLRDNPV